MRKPQQPQAPSPRLGPSVLAAPLPRGERGQHDRVCVLQIGGAHGVRGELRLRPFTQDPASGKQYGPLETENGRRFESRLRPAKDALSCVSRA